MNEYQYRGPRASLNQSSKACGCSSKQQEFDPELAHRALSHKVNQLSSLLAAYMRQVPTEGSGARTMSAIASTAVETPGSRMAKIALRIVGGQTTAGFPECCLVGRKFANGTFSWFCSGVLIHPRIALTAGHCHAPGMVVDTVAFGISDQNQLQNAELKSVKTAVTNPLYLQSHRSNDITVLVLRDAASTPAVQIASGLELAVAKATTLVGFGNNDVASSKGFGIKREVEVDFVALRRNQNDDLNNEESRFGFDAALEFVAGGEGHDSCNGDSGGPAYVNVGTSLAVAGLTSRATDVSSSACGDGGIYTRVDAQREFIQEIARKNGVGTIFN